jgi:hypothetical protein
LLFLGFPHLRGSRLKSSLTPFNPFLEDFDKEGLTTAFSVTVSSALLLIPISNAYGDIKVFVLTIY